MRAELAPFQCLATCSIRGGKQRECKGSGRGGEGGIGGERRTIHSARTKVIPIMGKVLLSKSSFNKSST